MYGRVWGEVRVGCRVGCGEGMGRSVGCGVGYGEGSVGWGTCGVEVGKETTFYVPDGFRGRM